MNSVIGYGITMAAGLLLSAVLYVLRARRKGLPLSRILAGIPAPSQSFLQRMAPKWEKNVAI